jgi:transcriptional regulator with XRE-family HTH domain
MQQTLPTMKPSPGVLFARRVQQVRKKIGMSQEGLAAAAQLSRSYMGRIERAEQDPSLSTICKIAAALNVKPAVLLKGL